MRESQPYRRIMKLTELDQTRLLREADGLRWSEVDTRTLGKRRIAWLRVTDSVEESVPTADATFRYVDWIRQAPITVGILRRIGCALGAPLDRLGSAYLARMTAGDVVPPHADDYSPYYGAHRRVQVVLQQGPDAAFHVAGERVPTQARDCGVFDNLVEHSVAAGSEDRCVLLVDVPARSYAGGLTMEFAA